MLTNNIDGLTNGAMGTVTHVIGHDVNTAILVKFDNASVRTCSQAEQQDISTYPH